MIGTTKTSHRVTALSFALFLVTFTAQAASLTWDAGGGDGLLGTANNWNPNQAPVASDTLNIGNGDTVSHANNLPGSVTINLSGSSSLSTNGSVIRLNNANLNVGAGTSLIGAFWDLNNGDLTFEDGASATMANWEQKGTNTFTFNLSATGFTTLNPNTFRRGGGALMSNATYTVDMAAYTGGTGTITLVDFITDATSMTNATFQTATLNVINKGEFSGSHLTWDDSTDSIQLHIMPVTWDGDAGDGLWISATNWDPDRVPANGETIVISNGDTVSTAGISALHAANQLPNSATITLSGNSTLTPGTDTVVRFNGSTLNVESGSILTTGTNKWFDLNNGTLDFEDGAINTVHNWEHKGTNTFNYTLSATGFTPLTPTQLRFGGGSAWANSTFNIDIAAYDLSNGHTVTLLDAGSTAGGGTFNPTVNINAGATGMTGELTFDAGTSELILTIVLTGSVVLIR